MSTAPPVRWMDRTTPPQLVTLVLLAGLSALNMSIFLPSLAHIAADFDAPYAVVQLTVSAYLAATAIVQIGIGPLSDRFGRRNVSLISIGFFLIATLGALFSQTIEAFLIFRILQASVATGMVLSRAVVRDMYPQDQAASMIGYVTMGMALIPMIGPVIGGFLDQLYGWRMSFVFLSVVGLGTLILCFFDMGETIKSGGLGFREQVRTYPELFASPRFWGYALCAAFGSGAFFAFLGGGSFVAVTVFGLPTAWAGVALGAPAVGYAVGNFFSGRYATRLGINKLTLIGCVLASLGMGTSLILGALGVNSAVSFFALTTILGLGNGLVLPNTTAGLLSVRPHLAATASGLGGAMMIGGGAALSQLAGTLLDGTSGALPLQLIMFLSSFCSIGAILFVIWRTRTIQT